MLSFNREFSGFAGGLAVYLGVDPHVASDKSRQKVSSSCKVGTPLFESRSKTAPGVHSSLTI